MRNIQLHTICILTLSAILTIGFNAAAELDPNMEAGVDCSNASCMFRGNPQAHDAISGFQKLPTSGSDAKLMKVNRYADNMGTVVDRNVEAWSAPIGELESAEVSKDKNGNDVRFYGTAELVSPCYIVTNHHVAYRGDAKPVAGKDYTMKFRIGASNSAAFKGNTIATPVELPMTSSRNSNDLELMRLKTCVGERPEFGWLEVTKKRAEALTNSDIAVAGYAGDKERGQMSLGLGKVTAYDKLSGMLKSSAPDAEGMSGGAVLVIEDGLIKLAGITDISLSTKQDGDAQVFSKYDDAHANVFISAREFLNRADIKAMLDEDKARVGSNPALVRFSRPLPSRADKSTI